MAVLGSVLIDNQAYSIVTEHLSEDSFYKHAHRKIFEAMEKLSQKGEAVDVLTLSEELKRMGEFEKMGGATYLTEITDNVYTSANVEHYARVVFDKYLLRRLVTISGEISTEALLGRRGCARGSRRGGAVDL